jgi:hypothetical protein
MAVRAKLPRNGAALRRDAPSGCSESLRGNAPSGGNAPPGRATARCGNAPSGRGDKPNVLLRDALILELAQEAPDADGAPTPKLRLLARKLIDDAIAGNLPAAKEIADRVDGRPAQAVLGDAGGEPVQHWIGWVPSDK